MASRRREARAAPQRLILDSGAIISLSRGEQRVRAFLSRALELGDTVEVPVVVVAETTRGGPRDVPVNRVLNAIGPAAATLEAHGRIAGRLLGLARSSSTLDAIVVAHAVLGSTAVILTGDEEDLRRLAAPHPEVLILGL